jgi:hypothetical protein
MSLNLHSLVRGVITVNKADSPFTVYRSVGQQNVGGIMTALYIKIEGYTGQWQSEGDSALYHADLGTQSTITRKVYLYAPKDKSSRVWSVYRLNSRSGDYLQDDEGNYWLVTAVLEDFSDVGWECLRVTLQQTAPKITIKETE